VTIVHSAYWPIPLPTLLGTEAGEPVYRLAAIGTYDKEAVTRNGPPLPQPLDNRLHQEPGRI
jgi:hypothetical protein